MHKWILGFLLSYTSIVNAGMPFNHYAITDSMDEVTGVCYAKAMIGYDSVVNSRVGLNPEESIHITKNSFKDTHPLSNKSLLRVIMGAYLWNGAAHSYAIITLSDCVRNTTLENLK